MFCILWSLWVIQDRAWISVKKSWRNPNIKSRSKSARYPSAMATKHTMWRIMKPATLCTNTACLGSKSVQYPLTMAAKHATWHIMKPVTLCTNTRCLGSKSAQFPSAMAATHTTWRIMKSVVLLYKHGLSRQQAQHPSAMAATHTTWCIMKPVALWISNYWIIEKALMSEVSNKWHTPVLGVFWDCNWLWFEEAWGTDDLLRWLLITLRAVDWTTCFEILKSAIRPASLSTKPTR